MTSTHEQEERFGLLLMTATPILAAMETPDTLAAVKEAVRAAAMLIDLCKKEAGCEA